MRKVVVLVHPGSLVAAASEGEFPRGAFTDMLSEIMDVPPEDRFLLAGGLIPHSDYPQANELAKTASVVNPEIDASPDQRSLSRAARAVLDACGKSKPTAILVTGAWADPSTGCASAVFDYYLATGCCPVSMSPLAPIYGDEWHCSKVKIKALREKGRWADSPAMSDLLVDTFEAGALDGACFPYALAAKKYICGGRMAAVVGKDGAEHFFLALNDDLGFDGDGVKSHAAIIKRTSSESLQDGLFVTLYETEENARDAAVERGIPVFMPDGMDDLMREKPAMPDLDSPSNSVPHRKGRIR